MPASITGAFRDLLVTSLPDLFGGDKPAAQLAVTEGSFDVDPTYAEVSVSEPRPDDRTEDLPFDPAKPTGPYTLAQPPAAGPRRVSLDSETGARTLLADEEIVWDVADGRKFTLQLRPSRDPKTFKTVHALYGVVTVTTLLRGRQTLSARLQPADASRLEETLSLVMGVVALNRQALMDATRSDYAGNGYGAHVSVKSLQIKSAAYAANSVTLLLGAEVELKAERALAPDEGHAIVRIITAGRTTGQTHPIDIDVALDV